jgi:DNA uptake protein ComE-like DNA-binding protein
MLAAVPPRKPTNPGRERWVPPSVAKGTRRTRADADSQRAGKDDPDTDEWLVPGAEQPSKPRRTSRPKRTPSTRAKTRARQPKPDQSKPDADIAALRKSLAEAERRAEQAEQRADEATRRGRELSDRLEAELSQRLERELAATERKAKRRVASGPKASAAKSKASRPKANTSASNGQRLDINSVRFEDLRGLGLTVAQSARLIATRDVRNGFDSLKELDELPDLPSDVVLTLKRSLQV